MIGMQFAELSQLPQMLAREKTADRLIRGIDVFDSSGQVLYSSDRSRVGLKVPPAWNEIAARAKLTEWSAAEGDEYVAGISIKNSFDLTVGYLAMRYSRDEVDAAAANAGREILVASLASFGGIALLAPLALILVIRRFERDIEELDAAASHLEDKVATAPPPAASGAFGGAIDTLRTSLRDADRMLDELRTRLDAAK
jgi:hypothetical protein